MKKMLGDRNFSNDKLDYENEAQQAASQQSFHIRPDLVDKFRPVEVKETIQNVLSELLSGKTYNNEDIPALTKDIAGKVRDRVRNMQFNRYKLMVQVVLGEQHGAGVKIGARCMWDAEADSYACADYQNDSLFCMAAVFAVHKVNTYILATVGNTSIKTAIARKLAEF